MHHLPLMSKVRGFRDLEQPRSDRIHGHGPGLAVAVLHPIEQAAAGQILHHDKWNISVNSNVQDANDVWMLKLYEQSTLTPESLACIE